ncbi:MAG TPA: hypothetical protein VIF62_25595 [Labilithrix sp.]|jgi:hypothetical protein
MGRLLNVVAIALSLGICLSLVACDKLLHRKLDIDAAVDTTGLVDAAPTATVADTADAAPEAGPAPSATHAVVAFAPGSIPTGTFIGTVHEGSLPPYTMTAVLHATGGTITYGTPFGCVGTWTLTDHAGGAFHYHETITTQGTAPGARKCANGLTATLSEVKPGTTYNYGEGRATATVSKH